MANVPILTSPLANNLYMQWTRGEGDFRAMGLIWSGNSNISRLKLLNNSLQHYFKGHCLKAHSRRVQK